MTPPEKEALRASSKINEPKKKKYFLRNLRKNKEKNVSKRLPWAVVSLDEEAKNKEET